MNEKALRPGRSPAHERECPWKLRGPGMSGHLQVWGVPRSYSTEYRDWFSTYLFHGTLNSIFPLTSFTAGAMTVSAHSDKCWPRISREIYLALNSLVSKSTGKGISTRQLMSEGFILKCFVKTLRKYRKSIKKDVVIAMIEWPTKKILAQEMKEEQLLLEKQTRDSI